MPSSNRASLTSASSVAGGAGLVVALLLLGAGAPAAAPVGPAAAASPAPAAPPPVSPYAALLPGLKWEANHEAVMAYYEGLAWKAFDERRKTLDDVLEIERLRRRTLDEVTAMRQNYVELKPGTEAYRVSIVETEFQTGTGESIFRFDDVEAQRYYFFIQDRLWKYLVAYNASHVRDKPFSQTLDELTARFGAPLQQKKETRRSRREEIDVLAELVWQDAEYRLRLTDQMPFFGTYVLTLSSRSLEDRIAELRGHAGTAGATTGEASDPAMQTLIDDIATTPTTRPDADILDQILGAPTKVDVVKEMPVSEDDFQPATSSTPAPTPGPPVAPAGGSGGRPAVDPKGPIIY